MHPHPDPWTPISLPKVHWEKLTPEQLESSNPTECILCAKTPKHTVLGNYIATEGKQLGRSKASDRPATSTWSLRFSIREGSLQGRSLIPEMCPGSGSCTCIVRSGLARSLHTHFTQSLPPLNCKAARSGCIPVLHIAGA